MVNVVEVPEWLERLPMAPEFHPTETEFADPIAYISKIEKEASAFGICKIIPPIPKPSKKYVFSNLNKSLLKRPDLDSADVNTQCSGRFVSNYGSVKTDGKVRAVFTTRQQELGYCAHPKMTKGMGRSQQPPARKQVWQSGELYTLEQFESKAKAFSRTVLRKFEEVTPLVVETLFWKAASEKSIYIEYANDVPGSGFSEPVGSVGQLHVHKRGRRGFRQTNHANSEDMQPGMAGKDYGVNEVSDVSTQNNPSSNRLSTQASSHLSGNISSDEASKVFSQNILPSDHEWQGTAGWKLSNSPWNLQVISRSAGSLTRFMLDDIPGVTSPMVYIGMLFSWFAWHVEDHELHSLNFLHFGCSKTWYSVPGDYALDFEEVIRSVAYGGSMDTLSALAILGEKTTILSPQALALRGIPCCRLVQNPGEFVVTFPRAYHIGFSHGFNCGEAANFGTSRWLEVAKEAAVRRTSMNQLPMLSHQQLLYLLSMSFVSRLPSFLIPGKRSSRLKDRLREQRELLVKRALIEDILEENTLLNELLSRDLSLRAVLWNSDILPPYGMEASPKTWISNERTTITTDDQFICMKGKSDLSNSFDQMKLHMETMNDLDIIDLSDDFEISSGALQCVACGILGYPFMCVIQPSKKTSSEFFNDSCLLTAPDYAENSIPATSVVYDESWNALCGFLRPKLFCLEHAVQIQELLQAKVELNMLVICHSDYQKINPNAAIIAEEIGCTFDCKKFTLGVASVEDLNLINLAIGDEKQDRRQEDWTSNLGVSLKQFVQVKKNSPAKDIEHTLKLRNLFCVGSLTVSNNLHIKWSSRKFRTQGKYVRSDDSKQNSVVRKKDVRQLRNDVVEQTNEADLTKGNRDCCTPPRKGRILLHYTRRRYRNRPSVFSETRKDGCTNYKPTEAALGGNICVQENVKSELDGLCSREHLVNASVKRRKLASEEDKDTTEYSVLTDQKASLPPVALRTQTSAGMVAKHADIASTNSDCSRSPSAIKVAEGQPSETWGAENSCLSTFASPCSDMSRGKESMNMNIMIDGATNLLHLDKMSSEAHCSRVGGDAATETGDVGSLQDTPTCLPEVPHEEGNTTAAVKAAAASNSLNIRKRDSLVGFVRSPCEGLRPRNRKEETITCKSNYSSKVADESTTASTKNKKVLVNPVSGVEIKRRKTQRAGRRYHNPRVGIRTVQPS